MRGRLFAVRRLLFCAFVAAVIPGMAMSQPSAARQAIQAQAPAAQSVTLIGTVGQRAILAIDGTPPRTLAVGESALGVQVVNVQGDSVRIRSRDALGTAAGREWVLRVGDAPQRLIATERGGGNGRTILLTEGAGGHFVSDGMINQQAVRFLVDTGATDVVIGRDDAARLRLDLSNARSTNVRTANGTISAQQIVLARVRVQDVELRDVRALISSQPMPYVLLGNSFLGRFNLQRNAEGLRLTLQ